MSRVAHSLRQSFIAGLLALLPVYVTVRLLLFAFSVLDSALGNVINAILALGVPGWDRYIPGLGIVATVALVTGAGWLLRYLVFKRVVHSIDAFLDRIPVVRSIHHASRQFIDLLRGTQSTPFQQVVLIEYPMPGRWTMALLSRDQVDDGNQGADDLVVVFVPSNHLHLGYPILIARSEVRPNDMKNEDAIKYFVSCGVLLQDPLPRTGRLPSLQPPADPPAPMAP